MAAAFATVDDLENRWRTLSPEEQLLAGTLLEDASAMVRALASDVDARIWSGDLDAGVPVMVVCSMVKRAMLAADAPGVRTSQETSGPFSQSYTFANPMGDLYLTAAEKKLLGVARQVGFTAPMSDWFRDGVC